MQQNRHLRLKQRERNQKKNYPAKKVYESDNMMIIHIEHVPTEYRAIGLFVTEHRDDKILKQEYKRQLKNDSDVATTETDKVEKSDLPKAEDVTIVGDYREIEINKNLVAKSDKAYSKRRNRHRHGTNQTRNIYNYR